MYFVRGGGCKGARKAEDDVKSCGGRGRESVLAGKGRCTES